MADALLVFHPLQGDCPLCLRSLHLDLDGCNTSVTSPTLRFTRSSLRLCFRPGLCSPLLVGSTVRFLAPLLLLRALRRLPFDRQPSHPTYKLPLSPFSDGCFLLVSASSAASPRTYRLSMMSLWLPSAPSTQNQVTSLLGAKQCSRPV